MQFQTKSIRPFIGSKNYTESRQFYKELGFNESILSTNMSYFSTANFGFYLQDAYVKDWIENTMVFMEVEDVEELWESLKALHLNEKYPTAKVVPIRYLDWGKECFLHDPSGILWHFGTFNPQ
ncbi:glyoxalase [Flavobacterium polysaccharolyticum]|uniref:Glyoxalase n=1 Tax=Flavobacterium polysaccharolyticum TaxID=3133148 RepID=A0ABU9NNA5_9FLAO